MTGGPARGARAGGAKAGGGIGGIKANGGGAAKSNGSAGTTSAVEERAGGRAGVSSGNSGKGLEGLGTKVRLRNEGLSAGGTGKDFAFEKNAFMEAVLAAAKRGCGKHPAGVMCACCVPGVGAEFVDSTSGGSVDS